MQKFTPSFLEKGRGSKTMNIAIDRRKTAIILALIAIIAALAAVKFYYLPKLRAAGNVYSVVYLATGEVYIGQLATWPKMELNNAYILQNVKDQTDAAKSNIQLTPLKDSLWAPKKLFLNEKNVIFYGPIEESSKAAEAIRNAGK